MNIKLNYKRNDMYDIYTFISTDIFGFLEMKNYQNNKD